MKKVDLRILMLEDESLDAELNKAQLLLLEEYNCLVDWAKDKESYLNLLKTKVYDIILSDYNLPQYNGLEALNDLKATNQLIPFIFVTGTIDEETAAGTIKAGAWDYVVKDRLFRLPLAIRSTLQLKEEKLINAQVEQQNQKLLMAIEQSPVHIVITNTDNIIEYVNARFTEVTGYLPEEVIGKNINILNPRHKENYSSYFENQIQKWKGEIESLKKDGTVFWESITISPLINEKGEATHIIAVKEDITQRKQMEQKLIDALNRAEQSDKLKEAFLQNLSHEIRTPMNAIVGFSELLYKLKDHDKETSEKYTSIILTNSYQLLSIVNDILTISLIQTGQETVNYNKLDINVLLDNLYELFSLKIKEKNLNFIVKKLNNISNTFIETDETKLTQILTNLLNNSLKFTHQGSIEIGYNIETDHILFYVKDTGIGIPNEAKDLIFERFAQADAEIKANYGGTGLGLSISKSFTQMLEGKLWVESSIGLGSTFFLSLPIVPSIHETVPSKESKMLSVNRKITLLLAEDETYNVLLIQAVMENENIKIIHAKNGFEALEIFKTTPNIDLILMDIKMPVMDGIQSFKEIRKLNKEIPVIAQTAYTIEHEKKQLLEMGFTNYISKPIKIDDLIEKIKKTIIETANI